MADFRSAVEEVFRRESGRIIAGLIRVSLSFDLAEEAMQDAFAAVYSAWLGGRDRPDAGAALSLLLRLVVERSRAVPLGRRPRDSGLISALWALSVRQRHRRRPSRRN